MLVYWQSVAVPHRAAKGIAFDYMHFISCLCAYCKITIMLLSQAITRVRFSPLEKSLLATTTVKGTLSLWSAESLRLLVGFKAAHSGKATDACFSPFNNMLLASAGLDGRIVFYDVISRKLVPH